MISSESKRALDGVTRSAAGPDESSQSVTARSASFNRPRSDVIAVDDETSSKSFRSCVASGSRRRPRATS